MSTARQAVLDALALVAGLDPRPSMPDTPAPGLAWPVWSESAYTSGKLTQPISHTYEVLVLLPAAYHPETVDAADGLVEQLMGALSKAGTVETARPVTVAFDPTQTTMPGVSVRVTVATC